MNMTITPSPIQGAVRIPGSKSHTIRALLIATLAEGTSTIHQPLESADTRSCLNACRHLGAKIEEKNDRWIIHGTGGKICYSGETIDVGNSGTTLYLAAGLAALADVPVRFTGDHQIQARPADKLLNALTDLGVEVKSDKGNLCAPFTVKGPIKGGKISLECPTSQYLSSLLMAAPLAEGTTEIQIPLLHEQPYAAMTVKWLEDQKIKLENNDYKSFIIEGGQSFTAYEAPIAADFSSATFFLCAAALTGCTLTLEGLDMNDIQGDKAVVDMLRKMGCQIDIDGYSMTITGGDLKGAELDLNATPDALPALAVTACFAKGKTILGNVPQARLKETDRIAMMTQELRKLGAEIEELEDGMVITGGPLKSGTVEGHDDHRIVMAMAVGALKVPGGITIVGAEAAKVTFPQFFDLLESIKMTEE